MKKLVIRFNAPVVLSFALLSLAALLLDGVTGGYTTSKLFCVYRSSLSDFFTYVRFFGHVLGHADYSHYMGNMLLLLLVIQHSREKEVIEFKAQRVLFCQCGSSIQFPQIGDHQ